MRAIPSDTTEVVRRGVERACKDFATRVSAVGFERTKKMVWTRRHDYSVEVLSLQRAGSTYGKSLNYSVSLGLNCGIRVLNYAFEGLALNGPYSDDPRRMGGWRYHLRFNAQTDSTYERCVDDLYRFVLEQGVPWFARFESPESLLASDSPLRELERDGLRRALTGQPDADALAASLRALGMKAADPGKTMMTRSR